MNNLKGFFEQVRNLDPNDPGRWPLSIRLGTTALLFILAASAGYYWFVWKQSVRRCWGARQGTELGTTLGPRRRRLRTQAYKDQWRDG